MAVMRVLGSELFPTGLHYKAHSPVACRRGISALLGLGCWGWLLCSALAMEVFFFLKRPPEAPAVVLPRCLRGLAMSSLVTRSSLCQIIKAGIGISEIFYWPPMNSMTILDGGDHRLRREGSNTSCMNVQIPGKSFLHYPGV